MRVAAHDFDFDMAVVVRQRELLGLVRVDVPRDGADDGVFLRECGVVLHVVDDGAALVACGAEYGEDVFVVVVVVFGHFGGGLSRDRVWVVI